jgi:hypothetical protein
MRYLPILVIGLFDASAVIAASVLVNIEPCKRKCESVRNETERYNALPVKLFHRTSKRADFVRSTSTRMSGNSPEQYSSTAIRPNETFPKLSSKWHE